MKNTKQPVLTAQQIRDDLIQRRFITPTNALVVQDNCIGCGADFDRLAKDDCEYCGNCYLKIRNSDYH